MKFDTYLLEGLLCFAQSGFFTYLRVGFATFYGVVLSASGF